MHIYGDSQLVINQVNNDYQTKDDKLNPYKKLIDSLRSYSTFVTFKQIPRVENKVVYDMATLASILQLEEHKSFFEFLVEELHHLAYDSLEDPVISTVVDHESYLCDQIIPKNLMHNKNC